MTGRLEGTGKTLFPKPKKIVEANSRSCNSLSLTRLLIRLCWVAKPGAKVEWRAPGVNFGLDDFGRHLNLLVAPRVAALSPSQTALSPHHTDPPSSLALPSDACTSPSCDPAS